MAYGDRVTAREFALNVANNRAAGIKIEAGFAYVLDTGRDHVYVYQLSSTGATRAAGREFDTNTLGNLITVGGIAIHGDILYSLEKPVPTTEQTIAFPEGEYYSATSTDTLGEEFGGQTLTYETRGYRQATGTQLEAALTPGGAGGDRYFQSILESTVQQDSDPVQYTTNGPILRLHNAASGFPSGSAEIGHDFSSTFENRGRMIFTRGNFTREVRFADLRDKAEPYQLGGWGRQFFNALATAGPASLTFIIDSTAASRVSAYQLSSSGASRVAFRDFTLDTAIVNPSGMTINESNGRAYIVAGSKVYVYDLNENGATRNTALEFNLTAANSDPTGISYERGFLYVSDQDRNVYVYETNNIGGLYRASRNFTLVAANDRAVGIDVEAGFTYVPDSTDRRVYVYEHFPAPPEFAVDVGPSQVFIVDQDITPFTIPDAGGVPAPRYSITGLPNGVTFNPNTRVVSGRPTATGQGTAVVTADNTPQS